MAENIQYQKVKEITDRLEQGIQELFESERYMEWLRTMSKFHDYSLNNTLLIAFQRSDATIVAGYTAWQKQFGRQVKKGEKAIKILAPAPYKEKVEMEKTDPITQKVQVDVEGKMITEIQEVIRPAFKVVNVFDVSQTDGRELPSLGIDELSGDVREYELFFEALKRSCLVPMGFEAVEGCVKGYYHQMDQRIAIREGMSQIQIIKTAIHEMAHQKLHATDPLSEKLEMTRNSKEVEAESVAYTVCQHYGIDTSDYSFAYIAGWSHGKETPELKASLNTIRKTANEMINEIDGHIVEINKELKQEQENRITCYLKISGSMGSEYEIDRIAGTTEQIEAALKEVTEKEIDNVAEFLESKGIAVLPVASSMDSEKGRYINPEYEYDFDTNRVYRSGIAIGHETTREEQSLGRQEDGRYRYYSTQRPIMPGTYPGEENQPVHIKIFDERKSVENGQLQAWGYLEYASPLSAKERENYELQAVLYQKDRAVVPERGNERKKSVLADLHQKKNQIAGTKTPGKEQGKKKSKEMELS